MRSNNHTIIVRPNSAVTVSVVTGSVINQPSNIEKLCQDVLNLYNQGDKSLAYKKLRIILKEHKENAVVYHLSAVIAYKEKKYEAAYKSIRKALSLSIDSVVQLNLCGLIQRNLGLFDAALSSYKQAIKKNGKFSEPYNNLAIIYRYYGETELAVEFFKKAIKLRPNYPSSYYNLSCVKNYILNEEEINSVKKCILATSDLNDKARFLFSLYNTYSKMKKFRKAFDYLERGNKAIFSNKKFYSNIQSYVNKVKKTYDISFYQSKTKLESSHKLPVFIVGMPRCGSSLLEQILSSHHKIFGIGESRSIPDILSGIDRNIDGDVDLFFNAFNNLSKPDLLNKIAAYNKAMEGIVGLDAIYTDKQLLNFKYLGFIKILLPNAKFIHMRRNPVDICFGCYEKKFTNGHEYSYDLISLAKHYISYQSLMKHWVSLFPDDIYEMDYEALVHNPEVEVESCLKFIGVEMEQSCLEFYKSDRRVFTASTDQVREDISIKSVGKWLSYEKQLRPLTEIFSKAEIEYLK